MPLLAFGGYWSIRSAEADRYSRRNTPEGLVHAIRLAPLCADYRLQLADWRESEEHDPQSLLQAALARNPQDASVWIRLGLRAEMHGDTTSAERFLLSAAQVSRQYAPRWTLVNYYFRRNRPTAFWEWTRKALDISYGDRGPVFRLCWEMTQDPVVILPAFPERPEIWQDYLAYLLAAKRLEASRPVAEHLLAGAQPAARRVLLDYTNTLLAAGAPRPALAAWNRLCARKLIGYAPLSPAQGLALTNGDFQLEFGPAGFDWRDNAVPGVSLRRGAAFLNISFSGKQPEKSEILWQYMPLQAGRTYEIDFEYQTQNIEPGAGPAWKITAGPGAADLTLISPRLSNSAWKPETLVFRGCDGLARLALAYERAPGTTRIQGLLSVRALRIRFRE